MDFLPSWPLAITPMMGFGLMLIVGAIGGFIAHRLSWLPSITGFLMVGFICGPSGLGLLDQSTIDNSKVFIDVALALILYRLGLSLDLRIIRNTPQIVLISLVESGITFVVVAFALNYMGSPWTIAVLTAAISISSSPAVLLHVAHETNAKGKVTENTKTLVALNNVISFVVFTAILPALHYSSGSDPIRIILQPLYPLAGSIVLGILLASLLHQVALKTQKARQYRLALVIGTIMLGLGLSMQLKLSILFAPLIIGIVVKSLEKESVISDLEFGPSFELFFIALFVFAGAGLHLNELVAFAPAVFVLVIARFAAKMLGVVSISHLQGNSLRTGVSGGLLLIPMAGLAIGLVQTTTYLFPPFATSVSAIVLGAVAIFETVGPPLAAFAFRFCGEAEDESQEATNSSKNKEVFT